MPDTAVIAAFRFGFGLPMVANTPQTTEEMLLSLDYLPVWLILEYQQIPDSLNESLYKLRFVVLWRPRLKAR